MMRPCIVSIDGNSEDQIVLNLFLIFDKIEAHCCYKIGSYFLKKI